MYTINIPAHIENKAAYEAAAIARIKENARKTRRAKWLQDVDGAQRVYDWLNGTGEFGKTYWYVDERGNVVDACEAAEIEDKADRNFLHVEDYGLKRINNPMLEGRFNGGFGEFLYGLRETLDEFGSLSDRQTQIVLDAIDRKTKWVKEAEERKTEYAKANAKSEWVGEIKQRRDWELVIKKVLCFENNWGYTYINVMNDQNGNIIIGKGTKRYGSEGDTVWVKATVKAHETRDGVKQTVVNRPTFLKG